MLKILYIVISMITLVALHELGHIIAAYLLRLKIYKIGAKLRPSPHFYVVAELPESVVKTIIYCLSGLAVTFTILLFSEDIATYLNLSDKFLSALQTAAHIQLILDTNPFLSDLRSLIINLRGGGSLDFKEGCRSNFIENSKVWYTHLILWITLIIYFI